MYDSVQEKTDIVPRRICFHLSLRSLPLWGTETGVNKTSVTYEIDALIVFRIRAKIWMVSRRP